MFSVEYFMKMLFNRFLTARDCLWITAATYIELTILCFRVTSRSGDFKQNSSGKSHDKNNLCQDSHTFCTRSIYYAINFHKNKKYSLPDKLCCPRRGIILR